MKTKIFVLLLALCLLLGVGTVASYAIEARNGEVGDNNGILRDADTTTTTAVTTTAVTTTVTTLPLSTTAPLTTAPIITTAPVTTDMLEDETGGSAFAIVLAILAAAAIVTLVVVLLPKMRR